MNIGSKVRVMNTNFWSRTQREMTMAEVFTSDPAKTAGVYFIQAGNSGPVKIGMTSNLPKRLISLQTAHYESLNPRLVLQPDTNGVEIQRELESALKKVFAHRRIRGEWFAFGGELERFLFAPEDHAYFLHEHFIFISGVPRLFPNVASLKNTLEQVGMENHEILATLDGATNEKITPGLELGLYEHGKALEALLERA